VNVITSLDTIQAPTAIALGNFDGIHRGHRQVIDPVLASSAGISTVVSFYPHPQEWFTGERRLLLTPLQEKANYLKSIGIEQLVLLPFNKELSQLPPQGFVEQVLLKQLQARWVSVGHNFRFGHRRSGTTEDLKAIASNHGIFVHIAPLQLCGNERISSSAIREALSQGDLERANRLLGRPYMFSGPVVHGQHLGRTIGFPTANLELPDNKFCPRRGVYYVEVQRVSHEERVLSMGEKSLPTVGSGNGPDFLPGVMNLGTRPTVDGVQQTVEVHLLDWQGDLYGQSLIVRLKQFLRPEQKFDSLDALKAQIEADCVTARSLVNVGSAV